MKQEEVASIWGYGMYPRRWFWGHVQLRRNTLVYDVEIHFKRLRFTFTFWRKHNDMHQRILPQ